MVNIIQKLLNVLGHEVVVSRKAASERSAGIWKSPGNLNVKALLLPRTTGEVSQIMKICHEYAQPVVPHGGLSGVAEGAITQPDEMALSLERMNAIYEIDEAAKTVSVGAGVILENLRNAVAEKNLLFPLDIGAKGSCMIGGNISTNAGGVQVIRYGSTRSMVLGLEVVLADGTILSSMDKMIKNNAGYDLKQLFIGSEGTLGIITKAVLKLEEAPLSTNTAYVAFNSYSKVMQFLRIAGQKLAGTLSSFELIWQDYFELMTSPPSHYRPPLPHGFPYYVLIEAQGVDRKKDSIRFQDLLENALESNLIEDAAISHTNSDFQWFWGIRESVDFIFTTHDPVFLYDISLPIPSMEDYAAMVRRKLQQKWPKSRFYVFGHMGDGNLHLFASCGQEDHATKHQVDEIVFSPLSKLGGSITAEHGIGLEKKAWLHLSRSPEEIQLMKQIKKLLDPKGILNRGKIIDL